MPSNIGSLESIRKKLLSLTPGKNPLLNFNHGRGLYLRIVDELPDQLYELLGSQETLKFQPVPYPTEDQLRNAGYFEYNDESDEWDRIKEDPTAAEWASVLGIDTNFELPSSHSGPANSPPVEMVQDSQLDFIPLESTQGTQEEIVEEPSAIDPQEDLSLPEKHKDALIQTLLFPDKLESTLRKIRSRANSAIEESGVNILYLAFGFLKWFESQDSEVERTAPLFLLPVSIDKSKLDRDTGTYRYSISFNGDDILPNLSLLELLRNDFGLALPELDNTTAPETYLHDVAKLFEYAQPRWEVIQLGTISFFNFSKLLMWRDLDPDNWPNGNSSLAGHPIIKRFLESESAGFATGVSQGDYLIDEIPEIHEKYPIIYDADSSQHSAIKDVLDGHNLIIEGPPGTGKSQTITNIIAAALANNKKVLFVADKLVALEVVKRRLDAAGLGDFCLELHSHKTQKRMFLDDLKSRITNSGYYHPPEEIQVEIDRYEELKEELNAYALEINEIWKETGYSIHQILSASTRYCDIIDIKPEEIEPVGVNGNSFTKSYRRKIMDDLQTYQSIYLRVSEQLTGSEEIHAHPWYGVFNNKAAPLQSAEITGALSNWQEASTKLVRVIDKAGIIQNQSELNIDDITAVDHLIDNIGKLNSYPQNSHFEFLPHLKDSTLNDFSAYIDLVRSILIQTEKYSGYLQQSTKEDFSNISELDIFDEMLTKYNIGDGTTIVELIEFCDTVDRVSTIIGSIEEQFANILDFIGDEYRAFFPSNFDGLQEISNLVSIASKLDKNQWSKRDSLFDDEDLDPIILEFMEEKEELLPLRNTLDQIYNLDELMGSTELKSTQAIFRDMSPFKWLKAPWRKSRRQLRQIALNPHIKLDDLYSSIDDLVIFSERIEKFNGHDYAKYLGSYYHGLDTNIDLFASIRDWYRSVRATFGGGLGSRAIIGDLLLTMPIKASKELRELLKGGLIDRIENVNNWWDSNKDILTQIAPDALLIGDAGALTKLKGCIGNALESYHKVLNSTDITIGELTGIKLGVEQLISEKEALGVSNIPKILGYEGRWDAENQTSSINDELRSFEDTLELAKIVQFEINIPSLQSSISSNPTKEHIDSLIDLGHILSEALEQYSITFDAFQAVSALRPEDWFKTTGTSLRKLLARNSNAIDNEPWLETWLQFIRLRFTIESKGFSKLFSAIDEGRLEIGNISDGFLGAANYILSLEILNERPHLCEFAGHHRGALQKQFAQYDIALKNLQRAHIAFKAAQVQIPYGNSGGRIRDYTELALINHECSKKTRFIPIRQLVRRAGKALIAMKPCFMMGPMSVAQFLEPGKLKFDLVIMDEASQIKPEEALGVIARADQLVVVGDPKQLPPTRFFDRIIDEEEDDETMAIEESESILDAVIPILPMRQLKWHYRSRHEALIKFSNHFFYDGSLVVFPSPHSESDEFGVKHTYIKQGTFENQINQEEAKVVAMAVKEHLIANKSESLGIATMNAKQRDRIELEIEQQSKYDSVFRSALEYNHTQQRDPLFIKNLENVQGDERDVIFISTTYGPNKPGGRVMQRFGPINSDVGWRRLNVLFTRSKKRMHVFTSMNAGDIVVSGTPSRGVTALRDFLIYAETGQINITQTTNKPPDSDFEIGVANRLQNEGYECKFQVGVAGYFIDIAVKDPNRPGEYVVGIECDGATYHSAKSARDRDRLRQEVLEGLGWEIRRIWSTDWFQNPTAAITPILKRLGKLTYNPKKELRQRLIEYRDSVLLKALPDLDDASCLLGDEMLDALMRILPATHEDFYLIPLRLRERLSSEEAGHIDAVLQMIAEADLA